MLNDEDRRQLRAIERQLQRDDPDLARRLGELPRPGRWIRDRIFWIAGFVAAAALGLPAVRWLRRRSG